jgi:hypothetical protein
MTDDRCWVHPAVAHITAEQARAFAFELLALAEHADRLTRHREEDER